MSNTTAAQAHLDARLHTICDELMLEGKTFTATDVSNRLKIEGFMVRHMDIAPKIRAYMQPLIDSGAQTQSGTYTYTLVYPTTFYAPNGVYIYAPFGTDVQDYVYPKMLWSGNLTDTDRRVEIGQVLDAQAPAPDTTAAAVEDDSIVACIKKIFVDELGINMNELVPSARLKEDLGADELDMVELVMRAEEEFGIEIPEVEIDGWVTFGDILEYATRRQQGIATPVTGTVEDEDADMDETLEDADSKVRSHIMDAITTLMSIMPENAQRAALVNCRTRLESQQAVLNEHNAMTDELEIRLFGKIFTRVVPKTPAPAEPTKTPAVTVTGFAPDGKPVCGDGRGMAWQPVAPKPSAEAEAVKLGRRVKRLRPDAQGRVRVPEYCLVGVQNYDVFTNGEETVLKPHRP